MTPVSLTHSHSPPVISWNLKHTDPSYCIRFVLYSGKNLSCSIVELTPFFSGHHHIVELRDALQNSNYVFEVMTYYDSRDLLANLPVAGFSDDEAKKLFKQIMMGLRLLHRLVAVAHTLILLYCRDIHLLTLPRRCGVVNLDISLENILCNGFGTPSCFVVLTDFGLAERVTHPVVTSFPRRGKKYYYAPEYFFPDQPLLNCFKIDMWAMVRACNVLIYMMICIW